MSGYSVTIRDMMNQITSKSHMSEVMAQDTISHLMVRQGTAKVELFHGVVVSMASGDVYTFTQL